MTGGHTGNHRRAAAELGCGDCGLVRICLPFGLKEVEQARFRRAILRRRAIEQGECVFRACQPLRSIYAIRSGSIKTSVTTSDGGEQITGFRLPAEILGLDAIAGGLHPCFAVALERTWICELSFERVRALAPTLPKLHDRILGIMSNELRCAQSLATRRRTRGAAANLSAFLLGLSERYHRLGLSAEQFKLTMSRYEIANYLGVAVETVSRLFARFEKDGLLVVRRRDVHLRDLPRLRAGAGLPDAGARA